ncbi:MAG: glutamate--tRNA ligase family protein, partial [bacterium]|nr:glutamate--tRNA ligase family protein [bacterium]
IEFARVNVSHTVVSKRKLKKLVDEGFVKGWDDPRMPTLAGLRRRGYTASSIRSFCDLKGVARSNNLVEIALLEHCLREELNREANRAMAVLRPLRVIIENYPEGQVEWLTLDNNPENLQAGTRSVPFSRDIYIEQEDFAENPPKKFHRLSPGGEVRLKGAYVIKCERLVKDNEGNVIELRCTYDPETKSGEGASVRKVKGTSHWVSVQHAIPATINLYDPLFTKDNPDEDGDFLSCINPDSLKVLFQSMLEPSLANATSGERFQFLRQGYFVIDELDSKQDGLVFNRIVGLKDAWARAQKVVE